MKQWFELKNKELKDFFKYNFRSVFFASVAFESSKLHPSVYKIWDFPWVEHYQSGVKASVLIFD